MKITKQNILLPILAIAGGFIALLLSINLQKLNYTHIQPMPEWFRLGIHPLIEEIAKVIMVLLLFKTSYFQKGRDLFVTGMMGATIFALGETILYLFYFQEQAYSTAVLRLTYTLPLHLISTALVSVGLMFLWKKKRFLALLLIPGGITLHILFNCALFYQWVQIG